MPAPQNAPATGHRPHPLQNRCAPDGTLHAVPSRGGLMGNRGGRLHRADGTLGTARWRSRAWICCLTAFKGRRRPVMGPGYTEVFFLDEATALAAGHRPCFECRRADATRFATLWSLAHGPAAAQRAPEMDRILHAARLGAPDHAPLGTLPPGTIFRWNDGFHLRTAQGSLAWSFDGYRDSPGPPPDTVVAAITPEPTRRILAAGYRPHLHPSAGPASA